MAGSHRVPCGPVGAFIVMGCGILVLVRVGVVVIEYRLGLGWSGVRVSTCERAFRVNCLKKYSRPHNFCLISGDIMEISFALPAR